MKKIPFFEELDPDGLPSGGLKAYLSYNLSRIASNDVMELTYPLNETEAEDFTDYLCLAGIKQFILTDRSFDLMETILSLIPS